MSTDVLQVEMMRGASRIPGRECGGEVRPCGRVWPNGEFSVGYAPAGGKEAELSHAEWLDEATGHLGLSNVSNSHTKKTVRLTKRGQGGLTGHGRRMLRNSVELMQSVYKKNNLSFCTLTLPTVTFEQAWMIASDWSRIVRVFFQKLGRYLQRQGLPKVYAACTEMQSMRVKRESHPALHLHFVIVGKRSGERAWAVTPGELRWLWASILGPMLPSVEFWGAVENMESIRKDASAYMAKYMSKGGEIAEPLSSEGTGWNLPTCWYSVSKRLRDYVNKNVRHDSGLIEAVEKACRDQGCKDWFEYVCQGEIDGMYGPGPHWFAGRLKREVFETMKRIWAIERGLEI